ncbi:MAG: hypothetical protein Q9169_005232 [Polycauliona sp. 2 TL-2023]
MGKRKAGTIEIEDIGGHKSKRPRANSAEPAVDHEDGRAQHPPIDSAKDPVVERELREARAARKLEKRIALREHRLSRAQDENANSRKSRDDDATAPTQPVRIPHSHGKKPNKDKTTARSKPVEVAEVAAEQESKQKPRPRKIITSKPGQPLQFRYASKWVKNQARKEKRDLKLFEPKEIAIPKDARDNKIVLDNYQGRGEFLRQWPHEWYFSRQTGGRMRDLDPLFSTNEEYLLVAFRTSVNVYSTSTSLLLKELRPSHHLRVSGLAMSPRDTDLVYISAESGQVQLWNFVTGSLVHYWVTQGSIYGLQSMDLVDSEDSPDILYTIDRPRQQDLWTISAHQFTVNEENKKTSLKSKEKQRDVVCVRQSKEPITAFKVVDNGRIIVATSGLVLTLGHTYDPRKKSLKDISYTWRDVECPEWISCIDVRTVLPDPKNVSSGKDPGLARTDIVVGGLKGALHVYDDLLRQLVRSEKPSKGATDVVLTSRKQHWHRNTVFSVKWSRDGNYIISGGLETTLLLWQLETGHINTLPHLGAPVEGIVVSPLGSSYAIRLADNSAMILSTAELKPTFSIAGMQFSDANTSENMKLPYLPTVDSSHENMTRPRRLHYPAANGPMGLLCAVPSIMPSRIPANVPQPASFLQTIDAASGQQLSRQALTRTKATDLNAGPESNSLREPDVVLMQLSQDGQWLATVDEWVPPKQDLAAYSYSDDHATEEQDGRREIYLKFWSWDKDTKIWSLVSRVDDPHASQNDMVVGRDRVLDLVSDPSSTGFATIGEDGSIKIWKASTRQRHSTTVRDSQGQGLVDWNCRSAIPLDSSALSSPSFTGAKLAYSSDGSVLAAALTSRTPWTIHLIDPEARTVTTSPYGPYSGPLFGLGIIERFLIVLSDRLNVWNLVTHELAFEYTLRPQRQPDLLLKPQTTRFALDPARGTFAIGLPYVNPDPREVRTNHHSQVIVFDPTDAKPLASMITQEPLAILIPMQSSPGYLIIDGAADFRIIAPGRTKTSGPMALPTPPATPPQGLENIYGGIRKFDDPVGGAGQSATDGFNIGSAALRVEPHVEEDDVVVVTQDKLAEVLDCGPAYAMPPVSEMFERVARLFAGRRRD